jgi:transposase
VCKKLAKAWHKKNILFSFSPHPNLNLVSFHWSVIHSNLGKLSTFDIQHSMVAPIPPSIRSKIVRYLLLHWRPIAIAAEVKCDVTVVYRIQQNLFIYGQSVRPHFHPKGAPRRICKAAENSLFQYLEEQPWTQQKEMIWFLWEEWGIHVHRSTISRLIKRRGWSNKKARRIGSRDEELRQHWVADLLDLTAEQLVFVDESMFNETIGWRLRAYAPIGQPARYHANISRGSIWSVLPAYTSNGESLTD